MAKTAMSKLDLMKYLRDYTSTRSACQRLNNTPPQLRQVLNTARSQIQAAAAAATFREWPRTYRKNFERILLANAVGLIVLYILYELDNPLRFPFILLEEAVEFLKKAFGSNGYPSLWLITLVSFAIFLMLEKRSP